MSFKVHPNTELILGPPGTGKTSTLLNRVENLLLAGASAGDIAYVSFTRKAAREAAERAMEKFSMLDPTHFHGFRTLHSMAYRHTGCTRDLLFNRKHAARFGKQIGHYIGGISVQEDSTVPAHSKGTQMMFTNNYGRCCLIDPEESWRRTVDMGAEVTFVEQEHFNDRYGAYLEENDLYDFTSLLEEFVPIAKEVPYRWLLVDESQDLMALQWEVVRALATDMEAVVIAGDDDQAIYQWSGAAVDVFLDLEYSTKTVLDKSFRLPHKVYDLANRVSATIENRYAKVWTPRDEEGEVRDIYNLHDVDMSKGEWLVLLRNNYLMPRVCDYLATEGFNYWCEKHPPFHKDLVRDIKTWEFLRTGGAVAPARVRRVYERMRVGRGFKRGFKSLPDAPNKPVTLEWLQVNGGLYTDAPWYEAFSAEDQSELEYMRRILRLGERLSAPRIVVSTIHSIKGGEADNVVLYLDISRMTAKMAEKRTDEEARVFYVGVTRARNNLYIMRGDAKNKYTLP